VVCFDVVLQQNYPHCITLTIYDPIPYQFVSYYEYHISNLTAPRAITIENITFPTHSSPCRHLADHTSESSLVFRRVGHSLLLKSAIGGNYLYASPEVRGRVRDAYDWEEESERGEITQAERGEEEGLTVKLTGSKDRNRNEIGAR
jgi:hypothetical protein